MVIGLVRDSFARCFCTTCTFNPAITGYHLTNNAYTKKSNRPRNKQPKSRRKLSAATEIRFEEKSRGGMCYEVIFADKLIPKPSETTSPKKELTAEDIILKLEQAEERRKSLENSRLQFINFKMAKLDEASRKRELMNARFVRATQEALEEKLESSATNREEHLHALRIKIAEHLENVQNGRRGVANQISELSTSIEEKMISVEENRNEIKMRLLEKLKEHDDYVQAVRVSHEQTVRRLDEKIKWKLEAAEHNRSIEKQRKLNSLKAQEKRGEIVRARAKRLSQEFDASG